MVADLSRNKGRAQPSMLVVCIFMLRYADDSSRGTWTRERESVMSRLFTVACAASDARSHTTCSWNDATLVSLFAALLCSVHLTVKDIRACHIAEGSLTTHPRYHRRHPVADRCLFHPIVSVRVSSGQWHVRGPFAFLSPSSTKQ